MATQPLILVVDDEDRIRRLMTRSLADAGFRTVTAASGDDALDRMEELRPDVVLLDLVMPGMDGIEVMRAMREQRSVPIILVTARGGAADVTVGLDLGADDYVVKPFHPDELAARVRAVLRRAAGSVPGGIVRFDDMEIDLEKRSLRRAGAPISVSRTEWSLLAHLAANADKVVLHEELLTKVWGPEYRDDLQYLRVWISRLRRRFGTKPGEPGRIRTFQGIGYLLDVSGAMPPAGGDESGARAREGQALAAAGTV